MLNCPVRILDHVWKKFSHRLIFLISKTIGLNSKSKRILSVSDYNRSPSIVTSLPVVQYDHRCVEPKFVDDFQ